MAKYWLSHKEFVWAVGKVTVEGADGSLTFVVDNGRDGQVITLPANKLETLASVQSDQEEGLEDICSLTTVSEAALLHTVRTRYLRNDIYTRSMRILIAVNPFQGLPIYSTQHIDQYMAVNDSLDLPPHVFGIGRDALRGLQTTEKAQAILISGESGAGKTESAKLILSFVAEAVRTSGASAAGIEERVLQTNPILEAFGNAMTVRNNNSSRFGKWLDLRFCDITELSGCALTSYLLETTRVCSQARNERGYHVFFQLLQARKSNAFSTLGLQEPKTYRYLKDGQMSAPGIDDKTNFDELQDALTALNFDETCQLELFSIVGGVLTLGNCEVQADGDASKLVSDTPAKKSAQLLGVNSEALTKCLLVKRMVIGPDVTETPLRIEQARSVRDGLARLLYGRMFLWIISRINMTLMSGEGSKTSSESQLLGVLDIAGFENFDINSLEQLLINLSNEHLQQNFNRILIKEEMEDCAREGIATPDIGDFSDNADCLLLIDGKAGVLDLLDETMVVPKATDMLFATKVGKQHEKQKRFIGNKVARCGFGIHHFAGDVTYTCDGWLEKNADRPPDDAAGLLASSSLEVLQEIGKSMVAEAEAAKPIGPAARGKARRAKSVSALFRESLKSLMEKISAAEPHYIRCIKPNKEKVPGRFGAQMVLEQLLLGGVLATVKMRQQGYAHRMPKPRFAHQFRCVLKQTGMGVPKAAGGKSASEDTVIKNILEAVPKILPSSATRKDTIAIGKTKIFMTRDVFKALERTRQKALFCDAVAMQRFARGFMTRKSLREKNNVRQELVAWQARVPTETETPSSTFGRARTSSQWSGDAILVQMGSIEAVQSLLTEVEPALRRAQILGFSNGDVHLAERTMKRMQLELKAVSEVSDFCNSLDLVTVEKATARLRGLGMSKLEIFQKLDARHWVLRTQLPLCRAMQDAIEEFNRCQPADASSTDEEGMEGAVDQLQEVVDGVKQVGLEKGSPKWLHELGGAALFDQALGLLEAHESRKQKRKEEEEAVQKAAQAAAQASAQRAVEEARVTEGEAPASALVRKSSRAASRKLTVSGLDVAEHSQITTGLQRATDEYDVDALEDYLRRAVSCNYGNKFEVDASSTQEPVLLAARSMFEKLQTEDFLLQAFTDLEDAIEQPNPPTVVLRRLEGVAKQMKKMPGLEEQAAIAQTLLQRGVAARSLQRGQSSVFKSMDTEELNLANRTFGTLSEFAGLKTPVAWSGHRQSFKKSSIKPAGSTNDQVESMLSHSKVCIAESLLRAPEGSDMEEYEAAALQNFRNILVCMGDRAAQECQRHASFDAVITLAKTGGSLCDEVYAQVMKQLTQNLSTRSSHLGWELLQRLCQQAKPSIHFAEFVRVFLKKQIASGEDVNVPKTCLLELDRPVEQSAVVGEAAEIKRLSVENSRLLLENEQGRNQIQRLAAENGQQAAEIQRLQSLVSSLQVDIARLRSETGASSSTQGLQPESMAALEQPASDQRFSCMPPVPPENQAQATEPWHSGALPAAAPVRRDSGVMPPPPPGFVAAPLAESCGTAAPSFMAAAMAVSAFGVAAPCSSFGMAAPPGSMSSVPSLAAGSDAMPMQMPTWESLAKERAQTDAMPDASAPGIQPRASNETAASSDAATRKAGEDQASEPPIAKKGKGAPPPSKGKGAFQGPEAQVSENQASELPVAKKGKGAPPAPKGKGTAPVPETQVGEDQASEPPLPKKGKGGPPAPKAEGAAAGPEAQAVEVQASGPPLAKKGKGAPPAPKGKGAAPGPEVQGGEDQKPEPPLPKKGKGAPPPPKAEGATPCPDAQASHDQVLEPPPANKGKGAPPAPKAEGAAPGPESNACDDQGSEPIAKKGKGAPPPSKGKGATPGPEAQVSEDQASEPPLAKKGKGAPPPSKGKGATPGPEAQVSEDQASEPPPAKKGKGAPPPSKGKGAAPAPQEQVSEDQASEPPPAKKGKGAPPPSKGKGAAPAPEDQVNEDQASEPPPAKKGKGAPPPSKGKGATPGPEAHFSEDQASELPPAKKGKGAPPPSKGKGAAPVAEAKVSEDQTSESPPAKKGKGAPPPSKGKGAPPPQQVKGAAPGPEAQASDGQEPKATGKGKGKGPASPPGKAKTSALLPPAGPSSSKGGAKSPRPGSASPRPGSAELAVLGVGEGGVEELWERLEDSTVMWALVRFQVGSGKMERTKMITIHFNGEDTPPVARGRLNARMGEALRLLGESHASLEVKRKEDLSIDWLCERLQPVFVSDDGDISVSSLKEEYERQLAEFASKRRRKSTRRKTLKALTAKERAACNALTSQDALGAVSDPRGVFNWALLEPTKLELHNAGYGGLDEMKNWLQEDKVLFGVIRFAFGQSSGQCGATAVPAIVKYVFIHWVGPSVSAVKRGQWNSKRQYAETEVKRVCVITFGREAHDRDDLDVGELVSEIKRLAIVDDGQGANDTAGGEISVEEYMASLEKERARQMQAEEAEENEEDKQPLPDIQTAVNNVRDTGSVNWMLIGAG